MQITNNRIVLKPVKLGIRNQKDVEVIEGLQAGNSAVYGVFDRRKIQREGKLIWPAVRAGCTRYGSNL